MSSLENYLQKKFKVDASYFLRGGFWNTSGQFVGIIGGVAISSLFAYTLSESDYGTYRYLIGIGSLLSAFSLTGLGQSVLQATAKKYVEFYTETLTTGFLYSLGITLMSLLGSFYYFYNENFTLALGCVLIAIFQPIINTYKNTSSFLQGNSRFREAAFLQTFRTATITFTSAVAILTTQNILILFTLYLATQSLINLLSYIYYQPKKTGVISKSIFQKYFNYAKHASVRNIITNISLRLDTIIIFQQLGAIDLSIYTIANIIPGQIKGSFKNIAVLLLPKYVQHDDIKTIKKNTPRRSLQLFLIFTSITVIYILFAPFIYKLLFPKYESAIFLSQLVALSFPALILLMPLSALQAQLKEKELYYFSIQNLFVTIIVTIFLITEYGLTGAIIAKVITRYYRLIIAFYYLYRQ